ncbi:MAG: translation initiation factor [Cyclobacteriaceae bacterium]
MSKKKNAWKSRDGIVYSTSEDYTYSNDQPEEIESLEKGKQNLRVQLDKSGRAGKQVTLVTGFIGNQNELDSLTKLLKTKCGVGGSAKDGDILIQGDVREKVLTILAKEGYRAKRSG